VVRKLLCTLWLMLCIGQPLSPPKHLLLEQQLSCTDVVVGHDSLRLKPEPWHSLPWFISLW